MSLPRLQPQCVVMGTLDEASFAVRCAKQNGRFPSGASAIQLAAAALPRPVAGPRTQSRGRKTRKESLMTNPTQPAAQEAPIGVIQTSYTVAVTYTQRPTVEEIQKLKAAGYQYDRGRWFKNQSDSNLATKSKVDQLLAA